MVVSDSTDALAISPTLASAFAVVRFVTSKEALTE